MGKQKRETTFSAHAVIEHPLGTRRFVLIEETATHKRGKLTSLVVMRTLVTLPLLEPHKEKQKKKLVEKIQLTLMMDFDIAVNGLIASTLMRKDQGTVLQFFLDQ